METLGKICFATITIIISTLIGGYVFMKLWQWFIVTSFHVQGLSFIQSIGLSFFLNYLKPGKKIEKESSIEDLLKIFIEIIIVSGLVLVFGWMITLFY